MVLAVIQGASRVAGPLVATGLIFVALVCVNAIPAAIWNQQGMIFSTADQLMARMGYTIARSVPPHTTVAVSAAGNITYFDNRTSIDLLGYSDYFVGNNETAYGYPVPARS